MSSSQPSTPAQLEWQAHWAHTLPRLQQLSRELDTVRTDVSIMRSSQLDAARLDNELTGMLREQFMRVFALFQPGVIASLQAELALLLDLLVFWFSIRQGKPPPGMALMNLRYRDERGVLPLPGPGSPAVGGAAAEAAAPQQLVSLSALQQGAVGAGAQPLAPEAAAAAATMAAVGGGRSGVDGPGLTAWQRGLYCLGAVVLKYGWAKAVHHAAMRHWGDAAIGSWRRLGWAALRRAESGYRVAALLNFLVFLRSGKYRSLLERLLRARPVYARPSAARAISFEYLNRQLVWSELSELLLFVLPLVDVGAIKRALRAHLPRLPALAGGGSSGAAGAGGGGAGGAQAPCGICSAAEVLAPWAAQPCGHRFCYYCLRSHCQADPGYTCPICLVRVEAMQRCVGAAAPAGGEAPGAAAVVAVDSSN